MKAMLRLIDRGQYSKTPALASTAASAASALAFLDPYAVLPLLVSRFYTAMDTVSRPLIESIPLLLQKNNEELLSAYVWFLNV